VFKVVKNGLGIRLMRKTEEPMIRLDVAEGTGSEKRE
jgi:hypothetical protein